MKVKALEKTGKTIDEAVEAALKELEVARNQVEVEVLEDAQKGFLGFLGSKPAKVLVKIKEDPIQEAKELLQKIIHAMKFEQVFFEVEESEKFVKIKINGEDLGLLIGRRGETLDALQYLVNLSINKGKQNRVKFILDVGDYRQRREQTLQELAHKLAKKVRFKKQNVILEPMNPHERRIIHSALQEYSDIDTHSEGEEPFRKVVISLKE